MSYDPIKWAEATRLSRPRRRYTGWLILLGIAVAVLEAIVETFAPVSSHHVAPNPIIVIMPVLALSMSPFARETWFTRRGLAQFDEFEREALFRATTRAYLIMASGVAAFLGWLWIGSAIGWPLPHGPRQWGDWCLAALGIALALPVAVAELTVPLPPSDEEDGPL